MSKAKTNESATGWVMGGERGEAGDPRLAMLSLELELPSSGELGIESGVVTSPGEGRLSLKNSVCCEDMMLVLMMLLWLRTGMVLFRRTRND
jgi:hypothetical protein